MGLLVIKKLYDEPVSSSARDPSADKGSGAEVNPSASEPHFGCCFAHRTQLAGPRGAHITCALHTHSLSLARTCPVSCRLGWIVKETHSAMNSKEASPVAASQHLVAVFIQVLWSV